MILDEIQPFLTAWDKAWAPVPKGATPAQRRAHFEIVARQMREPMPDGVTTQEFHIPVPGQNRSVRVRAFIPAQAGPRPAVVYMHGGAWMQGSPETHWDITAAMAKANHHVVVSVDYALAPEQPFPAALNDCEAVVRWVADVGADVLQVNRQAIAVAGDSAGGNLAAALALLFRDSPIKLAAQLLIYPAVDFTMDRDSHRENANGPIVMVSGMPFVNSAYCPNPADRENPLAAPLLAASHADLPSAFIAVAEHDPLRDEGIEYARVLQAAGVATQLDRGTGLIHGYLRAMPWSTTARGKLTAMCAWLKTQLG